MKKSLMRRGLSLALTLAMGLSVLPVGALAASEDGLCKHHPTHTDNCGFEDMGICGHICSSDNGCITISCAHTHVETCFDTEGKLNCPHACTDNEACYTPITNCLHNTHGGCGHSEGKDCGFAVNGCEECEKEGKLIQIKGTDVTIDGYSFIYTGEEIRPAVTVKVDNTVLVEGEHYTVSYENNIGVGSASVTVTGMTEGGYEGIITIPFTIERGDLPEFTLVEIKGTDVVIDGTSFPYTGEAIEPAITVTVGGKVLTAGQDYSVSYANNVEPGTASVTVKGIATASQSVGYTGEVTIEFTITKAEQEETKPEETKPEETQPEETKPEETKPEETQPEESKPEETKPVEYKITKGNGKKWYQGSGKKLSFTIKAESDDFTGITINGKKLDSKYYTFKDDITVTLAESFLNKLTVGKYNIVFQFVDGEATGTFSVSDQYDATNPTTGDNIGLVVTVMLTSLAALGGCVYVYRKRFVK